jgi:hypothetical protein
MTNSTKKRGNKPEIVHRSDGSPLASNVGVILLELHHALRTAERCRTTLRLLGYSEKRWQEIIREVNPEFSFMLRPQILDAIITYLQSVGNPVSRKKLAKVLYSQRVGSLMRIRQTITANLRSKNLRLFDQNKIGLPTWTTQRSEVR